MSIFVLILVIATSSSSQSGAAAVSVEFTNQQRCLDAGKAMSEDAFRRGNFVLTYGCHPK